MSIGPELLVFASHLIFTEYIDLYSLLGNRLSSSIIVVLHAVKLTYLLFYWHQIRDFEVHPGFPSIFRL